MRVGDYMLTLDMSSIDMIPRHKIDVSLVAEDYNDLANTVDVLKRATASNDGIVFCSAIPVPEKIFRCGDTTTVIWKDGTKTTVKLMPGAEDSDYGAFTAALAKKIYGNNSKVMRYAGMVQRVKSKAEKKAERKAKHKAESESSGEKKYIVSQYGQVAEYKGAESESFGTGQKAFVDAKTEVEARYKAVDIFRNNSSLKEFFVLSNGSVTEMPPYASNCFGYWETSLLRDDTYKIRVFAKDVQEAGKVLTITPAPIPF